MVGSTDLAAEASSQLSTYGYAIGLNSFGATDDERLRFDVWIKAREPQLQR